MRTLRRRPKELSEQPSLYEAAGGGGLVLSSGDRRRGQRARGGGATARGVTSEPAEQVALDDVIGEAGATARARAQQIARRLALPRPPRERRPRRGPGELTSLRWHDGSSELNLDATLEAVAATPVPEDEDMVVRDRVRPARAVVLVVDISGSMRGERVLTAAATVGALSGALGRDRLAVVAFWSDAAVLLRLGERVHPVALVDLLARVPTQGLTNVSFALEVAGRQLAGVLARDARVLLLSDCVHNAGPDPRVAAARLPRLDVLLDTSGEDDVQLGRDLAGAGRGRCRLVHDHRGVPAALSAIFAPS